MNIIKIHELVCGSFCPLGCLHLDCKCLLVETSSRLILVDTGLGTRDVRDLKRVGMSRFIFRPQPDLNAPAYEQVQKLGFKPSDVTDIIPTHLDWDHAGGIIDFPEARVHVNKDEFEDAKAPVKSSAFHRYRQEQLSGSIKWVQYDATKGENWYDFTVVKQLEGLPPELLIVNLPGHSKGHVGIAIQSPTGWVLHAGDAYYHISDISRADAGVKKPSFGVRFVQRVSHRERNIALETQLKLTSLREKIDIKIMCAHE